MRSVMLVAALVSLGCVAVAKPKPKPAPVIPVPPEYIDPMDAAETLAAHLRYTRAEDDLEIARLQWEAARARFESKYDTSIGEGGGWDKEADGRLRARQVKKRPAK